MFHQHHVTDRSYEYRNCVGIFQKMAPKNPAFMRRAPQQKSALSTEALGISASLNRVSELMDKLERDLTSSGGAFDSREAQVVEEIRLIGRRLKDAETRMDRLKVQSSAQSLNSTTKKHWSHLLGHSLHPRFKALAKRFKQANTLRVASLQSMHNRHEKYFTKDLVHLSAQNNRMPIKNNQLPFQKLKTNNTTTQQQQGKVESMATATSTATATAASSTTDTVAATINRQQTNALAIDGGGATGYRVSRKQYYQSPHNPTTTATTPTTFTNTTTPSYYGASSSSVSSRAATAPATPYSRSASTTGTQLRNRRGPGGGVSLSSTNYPRVTDNPYVKNVNPYARTNPYASHMNRPPPQNSGANNNNSNNNNNNNNNNNMMGGGMGGGQGQQQSYSTSNASRARERVENAKMVAKQFAQVGEMTATLAEIVEQQDEWIADLETETDQASEHVERGQTELLKLWQNVSGDRGLMLKLFAVLIFFIILFFWLNRVKSGG